MTERKGFEDFCKRTNPKYKTTDDSVIDRAAWKIWQEACAWKTSMNKTEPCTNYRVTGIRYRTNKGTFFTENQNDVWESRHEILMLEFLFEAVLSSRQVPNV